MGFQFVDVAMKGGPRVSGVAYIGSVFQALRRLSIEQQKLRVDPVSRMILTLEGALQKAEDITSLRVVTREWQTSAVGRETPSVEDGPAPDAPVEKPAGEEEFKRFSAFANDRRVTANRGMLPGTYATTAADASHITTGSQAVRRYALPNSTPAIHRFTIQPPAGTSLQRGIAQPAYGQPGGGVEVIFTAGSPDHTVTLPPKQAWFDARIMMDFKDADGKKLKSPPAPNTGKSTDGWIERSVQFLVPAGAQTLDFIPTLFQVAAGTFDLDDVVLKPADPAPLAEKAIAAAAAVLEKQTKDAATKRAQAGAALEKGGSLISNGDFETDSKADQWPDDWGHPKGASWELEAANRFLRLKADEPGKTVLLSRVIPIPEGAKALELTWRQRVSDLKVGKEPWFDARFMMDFKDAAGKKLSGGPAPNTRKNTDGWMDRKVAFLVPEGAVTLDFMPALFQVQKGTFDLDDIVLKPTDPQALVAANRAAEAERKASEVPAEAPQQAKWPQELRVEGNKVLTKDGKPIRLQGVNVVSLEWSVKGEQVMKATQIAIEQWKANIIRLPVKEEYWFGGGAKDGGAGYRELVDDVVTLTANRGAYLMLDLHRFKAPRQEHADFWKDAAARYKDHPAVIFDLFNEPHGTSWEVWRDGGFVAEKKKAGDEDNFTTAEEKAKGAKGFQAIGMQALLDAVRGTGARNVVLVGGLDYAYDLSGMAKGYALTEKGGNGIILSTHIYPWKKGWQEKVLILADKHPILVGEVGANTKKMDWLKPEGQEDAVTWVPAMLGLIQKHELHWTAFSFHPKSAPHLLTGWDYTPTPEWGAPVKRALAGEKFELDKLR